MVSLTESQSFEDPIYVRTHFLGRVASEDLGIAHQKQSWSKTRTHRHQSDLEQWGAHWFQPITTFEGLSSDSDSSDDEEALPTAVAQPSPRARSSTLPVSRVTVPQAFLTKSSSLLQLNRDRSRSAPDQLLPPKPLTIDTLQPLRLSSTDLNALSKSTPSSRSPVRIEYSESDGSCHGDAGDQDPEAQLAAGIIKLRGARKVAAKQSSRTTKRRSAPTYSQYKAAPEVDDADLIDVHGGANFVLRFAEAMLDFGSAALERLSVPEPAVGTSQLQPQRRMSTTPKQLAVETESLSHRRRRRQQARSANVSRNTSSHNLSSAFGSMARTLSLPRLPTLLSPATSLKHLSMSTVLPPSRQDTELESSTSSGFGQHSRTYSGYGLDTYADVPSAFAELNNLDAYGDRYHSTITALFSSPTAPAQGTHTDAVSPLWKVSAE